MIRAVTLDFWNTLYADAPAIGAAREAWRRNALAQALGGVDPGRVEVALASARREWQRQWQELRRTPGAEELAQVFAVAWGGLPEESDREAMLAAFEEGGLRFPPRPIAGAIEAVRALACEVELAVVSDTSFTPGRLLREVLAADGWLDCFQVTVFSDEVGAAKPDPLVFRAALEPLGAAPGESLHCGDLQETDIAGAKALGMRAALYHPLPGPPPRSLGAAPDHVVAHLGELSAIVSRG